MLFSSRRRAWRSAREYFRQPRHTTDITGELAETPAVGICRRVVRGPEVKNINDNATSLRRPILLPQAEAEKAADKKKITMALGFPNSNRWSLYY